MQNNIQKQYEGYANTNLLWKDNDAVGIKQFKIETFDSPILEAEIGEKMRLGFRVERFIGSDLRRMPEVEILEENIQVRAKKRTIGELDCLLLYKGQPIHLEIIFKLYLYDSIVGTTEIDHWIGGNRRDSFSKKLNKLKTKQLPLLYHPNTLPILEKHNLRPEDIEQRVHFKAQLYKPFKQRIEFNSLNESCVKGFYLTPKDLSRFNNCEFFIPYKNDWLLEPQLEVEWWDYKSFKEKIDQIINFKSYPLCWLKYPDNTMEKFFVVWWDNHDIMDSGLI